MADRIYPNILAYLKDTGITQEELARRLGISQGGLSKIINNIQAPRLGLALRIERVCRVPLESLIPSAKRENVGNSCV